ncbi:SGNH/GDSL hydrolase family protein [Streptacidiphilus sp. PB12-B1b]|nr:SGNH/GDSL hydrolase family protein [Streptacidiphilus sp. PB12-B1b]
MGVASAALAAAALTGATAPAAVAHSTTAPDAHGSTHHAPDYYVSLGDSLAAGYQPNAGGNTDESYTDQLYARLRKHDPNLVHVKLGCSGETTQTMISGGICSYAGASSQLDAAVKFLDAHKGQVSYVTLDIGANDVDGCTTATGLDMACAEQGIATVAAELPQIAGAVHKAGGATPRYVGMNYYDPFLAAWLTGAAGQQLAKDSVTLSTGFNAAVQAGLHSSGFQLADVSRTFATDDFGRPVTLPGIGRVPLNVAHVCEWTWECTPYHNIHANTLGYGVIANVFERVLEGRR